jgi:heme exporter protein B
MLNLVRHELMFYIKNRKELIEISCLTSSIYLVFPFGLQVTDHLNSDIVIAVRWLAMLAGAILASSFLFARDEESGRLELYQLLPVGLEEVMLAKWLGCIFLLALPIVILSWTREGWLQQALGLSAGMAAIAALGSFSGALLSAEGRGNSLTGLLMIPLVIPVIIFGTEYCRQSHLWDRSLLFLIAYGLLLLPLTCLAGASAIRASN